MPGGAGVNLPPARGGAALLAPDHPRGRTPTSVGERARAPVTIVLEPGGLGPALKLLKRTLNEDVLPSVRRHRAAESPGQRRRGKRLRARLAAQKRLALAGRRARGRDDV